MSAVYDPQSFSTLVSANIAVITTWYKHNPGKSVEDGSTALTLPYEVIYEVLSRFGFVIMPSASGELQFPAGPRGPGRP